MNSFFLFLLNPNQYFLRLNDGKLRRYLLNLLVVYVIVYTLYILQIESHENTNINFIYNNFLIDLICYFLIDIVLILFVSGIIFIIAGILHTKIRFYHIVFNIFSLTALELIFMIIRIIFLNILDGINLLKAIDGLSIVFALFYLYFPIKYIFKASFARIIIIQSITIFGCLAYYFIVSSFIYYDKPLPDTSALVKHLSNNKITEAINESSRLINKYPDNANLMFDIGENFTMYLLINPETALVEDKTKNVLYQSVFHQAEKSYAIALKLDPRYAEARRALGNLYYLNGDNNKAIEQYAYAIEEGLSSPDIYRKMANGYFRLGNREQAEHYYKLIQDKNKINLPENRLFKIAIKDIIDLDLEIDAEAQLEWHVIDEMLYNLSSGDDEMAKLWIKGALSMALNKTMLRDYENESRFIDAANSSMDTIIADANQFFKKNEYGIEISNIELH